jgi:hypothetical protein
VDGALSAGPVERAGVIDLRVDLCGDLLVDFFADFICGVYLLILFADLIRRSYSLILFADLIR